MVVACEEAGGVCPPFASPHWKEAVNLFSLSLNAPAFFFPLPTIKTRGIGWLACS